MSGVANGPFATVRAGVHSCGRHAGRGQRARVEKTQAPAAHSGVGSRDCNADTRDQKVDTSPRRVGSRTQKVGSRTWAVGSRTQKVGSRTWRVGSRTEKLG